MLRDYLQTHNVPGTVMLLGCPAEEGGSGKTYLARAGVFDALDLALAWHPGGGKKYRLILAPNSIPWAAGIVINTSWCRFRHVKKTKHACCMPYMSV